MIKMIVLLLGLAIGFGGGVWYGARNPDQAKKIADEEERRVLEKQKELLAKVKSKLDQLASSATSTGSGSGSTGGRSGFVGAGQSGAKPDPEIDRLRAESDQQLRELDHLLKK
jgi:hypothetical protein